MPNLVSDTYAEEQEQNAISIQPGAAFGARRVAGFAATVVILIIYSYPALRTATNFGTTGLPPEFAPDLSLYLNLSGLKTASPGQVLNPYYLVPVPSNGTAYLKFRLGADLFSGWDKLLDGRIWLAMFLWNLFWWGLLCAAALWLFGRFLPLDLPAIRIAGLGLLMLVNIGMARPLLTAWVRLPSLSRFQNAALELPFMRAFTPQILMPLLLAYLGLQMVALGRKKGVFYCWAGMGVLQLLALLAFPYTTLMMAGLTLVSVLCWMFSRGGRGSWYIPAIYGAGCAIADGAFLMSGSLNLYASHSSLIHFQTHLLPHLVGGTWLILCVLTVSTFLAKSLPPEVRWTLAGLGATNLALMLGDAVVPSAVLLLSEHAAYFAHPTAAVLLTFLVAAALLRMPKQSNRLRISFGVVLGLLSLNGIFLSVGTYQAFLQMNRQQAEVARLLTLWQPAERDLLIARSLVVDDSCGWAALLARAPILFCTDAEVMLTPQQNRDIHRFRQAVYLYLSGNDSGSLQRALATPDPSLEMYQLGYWAEAALSSEGRNEGIHAIQVDLIPLLEKVERQDVAVRTFFRKFRRIIVIDNQQDRTFDADRLALFLKLEGQQNGDDLLLLSFSPK
jgi:hypothetical protein